MNFASTVIGPTRRHLALAMVSLIFFDNCSANFKPANRLAIKKKVQIGCTVVKPNSDTDTRGESFNLVDGSVIVKLELERTEQPRSCRLSLPTGGGTEEPHAADRQPATLLNAPYTQNVLVVPICADTPR